MALKVDLGPKHEIKSKLDAGRIRNHSVSLPNDPYALNPESPWVSDVNSFYVSGFDKLNYLKSQDKSQIDNKVMRNRLLSISLSLSSNPTTLIPSSRNATHSGFAY